MKGRVNEVVNETSKGWTKLFQKNLDFLTSQEEFARETYSTIPDKSKGKGILGSSTPILAQPKPTVTIDTQPQPTVKESVQYVSTQTNFEQGNVQGTRNTMEDTPTIVSDIAPSG